MTNDDRVWQRANERVKEMKSALSHQVGGDHYKNFAIQPVEFIMRNDLSFLAGSIIKRLCRFDKPGGKGLQDLEKAKHEIDLIIALSENNREIEIL